ncbi:hypothetical protein JR316_0001747 [Psilocybe cubensis]|uniref:F-box domain-containing protein n=2 Tax=Psilocybe cubensis TaxID=181762 RepID=A0A8H7Y208_PSICU|nr:hypothetical protein JR316_0001747 [Psilocybe cubensis]KAH9484845.1 hypothetical protein JR316_0001747 [Psilocybe cubensis]
MSVMPPNYILPPEILNEIFLLALPHAKRGNYDALPTEDHTAVAVSQTCKFWRQVALESSALWTEIYIQLLVIQMPQGGQDRVVTFPRLDVVDLWLERSKQRPLTIVVDGASSDWQLPELLSRLLREIHRWRNVDFQIGNLDKCVLGALQDPICAPKLEAFSLRTNISFEGSDLVSALPLEIWNESPLLRQFTLVAGVVNSDSETYFLNWAKAVVSGIPCSRLTHLCIGGPIGGKERLSISEAISILSMASNLISCILTSVANHDNPVRPIVRKEKLIRLENLENLSITANHRLGLHSTNAAILGPLQVSLILCFVSMPNLKSLVLVDKQFWLDPSLGPLVRRFGCKLQELVLHVLCESHDVIEFLVASPELTQLCVWNAEDVFLSELVRFAKEEYQLDLRRDLCNKLEKLALGKGIYNAEVLASIVFGDTRVSSKERKGWPLQSLIILDEHAEDSSEGEEVVSHNLDLDWLDGLQPKIEVDIIPLSDYIVEWVNEYTGRR